MCFSASASFTASLFLVPTGIYCIKKVRLRQTKYLPLASCPLIFGIQQAIEGVLWLGIEANRSGVIHTASLGFLFFSQFFWLFWIPYAALALETQKSLQFILTLFTIAGFLFGALLYLPLVVDSSLLDVSVIDSSIDYTTTFLFEDYVPKNFSFFIYLIVILFPLALSSNRDVNLFGVLVFLAAIATYFLFIYAFISVWCFFAAVLSLYLVYAVNKVTGFAFLDRLLRF